jgi:hypothetical protein
MMGRAYRSEGRGAQATRDKLAPSFLPINLNNNELSGETPDKSRLAC